MNHLDIPIKDEIADIALKKVVCEEKVDLLEDTIYILKKEQKKNIFELQKLKESLVEMLIVVEAEVKSLQGQKIKSLEKELDALKQLFVN
jgi:hypothetical protein